MPYDINAHLRQANPVGNFLQARDAARNALMQQDQLQSEQQLKQAQMDNLLFNQNRQVKADQAAQAQAQQEAEQQDHQKLYVWMQNLAASADKPQQFNFLARRILQTPLAQKYQLAPEDLTPESIQEYLAAAASEAGAAPQAAPQPKYTNPVAGIGPDGKPVFYRFADTSPQGVQVSGLSPIPESSQGPKAPTGYQFTPEGTLAPIPGGPADPSSKPTIRDTTNLRKEYEGQDAVKNYRSVIQLYDRATKAPNTRAGDISVIYALGKMFDPNSVVREGELILAQNAAPWLRKLASTANSQITGKGALSPQTRQEITAALNGQVESMRAAYEQERNRYSEYAKQYSLDPFSVVGNDPGDAYKNNSNTTAPSNGWGKATVVKP